MITTVGCLIPLANTRLENMCRKHRILHFSHFPSPTNVADRLARSSKWEIRCQAGRDSKRSAAAACRSVDQVAWSRSSLLASLNALPFFNKPCKRFL